MVYKGESICTREGGKKGCKVEDLVPRQQRSPVQWQRWHVNTRGRSILAAAFCTEAYRL
jgi:hypothetical protein